VTPEPPPIATKFEKNGPVEVIDEFVPFVPLTPRPVMPAPPAPTVIV
jgi:hypothetical protein